MTLMSQLNWARLGELLINQSCENYLDSEKIDETTNCLQKGTL